MENIGFREREQRNSRRRVRDLLVQTCTFSLLFKWAACIFSKSAETNLVSGINYTLCLSEDSHTGSSLTTKLHPDFIYAWIYGRSLAEENVSQKLFSVCMLKSRLYKLRKKETSLTWKPIYQIILNVWLYEHKQESEKNTSLEFDHSTGHSPALWAESHRLTCDVCCHQSLRPDDLHLHHTDILQVVEGPPHALKRYRNGLKGQRETQISTEEKVRSIAWHFIKRREGTICPLTALIWKSTVELAFVVESNRGQMAKFNFI